MNKWTEMIIKTSERETIEVGDNVELTVNGDSTNEFTYIGRVKNISNERALSSFILVSIYTPSRELLSFDLDDIYTIKKEVRK